MDELIKNNKVLICAGSGGVGKTTVAAAIGVRAAQLGLKVLVLTIDPAKRLATTLGLSEEEAGVDILVPDQDYPGKLFAALIDPEKAFEEFVITASGGEQKSSRLFKNSLYRQLSTKLSGSQEFTSLDRLYSSFNSGKYDLVILDTPPTQHAIDFLKAPERLYTLFQRNITRWFANPDMKESFWTKVVSKGTQTVLNSFEKITGTEFVKELADFFRSINDIQDKIGERSKEVHQLLMKETTQFVLVTAFNKVKLKESHQFFKDLRKGGYSLGAVVVNRSFPKWLETEVAGDESDPSVVKLKEFYSELRAYYSEQEKQYENFQEDLRGQSSLGLTRIPDMQKDIHGLRDLEGLGAQIQESFKGVRP